MEYLCFILLTTYSLGGLHSITYQHTKRKRTTMSNGFTLNDGRLTLGENDDYFHIGSVEVINGDDDCNVTHSMTLESSNDPINPMILITGASCSPQSWKTNGKRLRKELAVRVRLFSENDNESIYHLFIAHHKGGVYVELVDSTPAHDHSMPTPVYESPNH